MTSVEPMCSRGSEWHAAWRCQAQVCCMRDPNRTFCRNSHDPLSAAPGGELRELSVR
jgi:hypothetical protein